jgi:hypothetical protein
MMLYIPKVLKCVVRDIAWSAGTGDGWTPWCKRGAIRTLYDRGAHSTKGEELKFHVQLSYSAYYDPSAIPPEDMTRALQGAGTYRGIVA